MPSAILIRPAIWPQQIWADVFNVFGRPFVKRFALCYQTVVCLYVLSCPVCDVRALWPNGRIKIKLGTHVGLGPGHIVLDGAQLPLPQRDRAHVYCGQAAGWIKMPFGMELGLGPGTLCYMGTQLHPHKGHSSPQFSARIFCGQLAG